MSNQAFTTLISKINTLLQEYNQQTGITLTGNIEQKSITSIDSPFYYYANNLTLHGPRPDSLVAKLSSTVVDDEQLFKLTPHITIYDCLKVLNKYNVIQKLPILTALLPDINLYIELYNKFLSMLISKNSNSNNIIPLQRVSQYHVTRRI